MKERLLKVNRILKVQQQLQKAAELKLAGMDRKMAELRQGETILLETLNGSDQLQGLFVEAKAKRLQTLSGQIAQLDQTRVVQRRAVLERAMQAKRVEKMVDSLEEENRRQEEKRALSEILDLVAAKPDASLP